MSDNITEIRVDDLHDSPFNPRETFHEADDLEMIADIKAHGRILQPLLVRPRIGPLFGNDPDAAAGFEVVFGHRRKRNGIAAGLLTLPCMVRSMDDAEARRVQISENLSRKDVHPMEEAKGFQALIDHDGETGYTIAEKFCQSPSYVYGRLKLLQACPAIRKACIAGEIGSEVALLFARQPEALQIKGLEKMKGTAHYGVRNGYADGGKAGYRAIRDFLNEYFMLDLDEALWKLDDAELLPSAGACTTCPKRAGCSPELFADVIAAKTGYRSKGGDNTCTDPDCFAAKKKQHLANEAAALAKASGPAVLVITGNKARSALGVDGHLRDSGAYIALSKVRTELGKARANARADSKIAPPQVVAIQDQRSGKFVEAVARADLVAAGVTMASPAKKAASGHTQYSYNSPEAIADRKRKDLAAERKSAGNMRLFKAVREAQAQSSPGMHELRSLAACLLETVIHGTDDCAPLLELWNKTKLSDLVELTDTLDSAGLTRLVLDCVLIERVTIASYELDEEPDRLIAAAACYGLDIDALRAEPTEPASTPSIAARAAKVAESSKKSTKAAPAAKPSKAAAPKGKSKEKALRADQKDYAGVAGDASGQAELLEETGA